jgi:hypothetical protein
LEKGLKYNLHHTNKYWINRLALEADTAVNLMQTYMRQLIEIHIQKLKKNIPHKILITLIPYKSGIL